MTEEVWKEVPFAIGYEVSNQGRLRSLWQTGGADPKPRIGNKWKVLKGSRHRLGYLQHYLVTPNGLIRMWLHRLVATVFISPPPFDKAEVRHMDGNPRNNAVGNLAWGTHAENQADIPRHGRAKCGESSKRATIKNHQAREIVQMWAMGDDRNALAEMYRVHPNTIFRITTGRKWGTITGIKPLRSTTD